MTLYNCRCRQVHETLNGFRDKHSAKSGPNLCQIWQVFGPWASPYGATGQMIMTVHNYRPRKFHRISNGENPSSSYRDMGSASLAAARPATRTVTTIPLQRRGLRGKKEITRAVRDCLIRPYARTSECFVSYLRLDYECKVGHNDPVSVKC